MHGHLLRSNDHTHNYSLQRAVLETASSKPFAQPNMSEVFDAKGLLLYHLRAEVASAEQLSSE